MAEKHEQEFKTIPAFITEVKSDDEKDLGIVEHLLSVYGVVDLGSDIAHKGMFTKTLQERSDQVRVVDNHNRHSVRDVIGVPVKFWEVDRSGLPQDVLQKYPEATGGQMVRTKFLLDTPEGKGAFQRIKAGAVNQFSFAYDAMDYDYEEKDNDLKVRNLRAVRLWEYGPVIFGMNPAAVAISAKGDQPGPQETKNPYDIFKVEDEYCVYEVDSDGKRTGEALGCHDSRDEAEDQMAALHANVEDAKGYMELVDKVRSAFVEEYGYQYVIRDIYDDYLVTTTYESPNYFKVEYGQEADTFTFAERESWVAGTFEFQPISAPEQEDSTDQGEEPDAKQTILAELELEQWEINKVLRPGRQD